jgi:hypothetical protein
LRVQSEEDSNEEDWTCRRSAGRVGDGRAVIASADTVVIKKRHYYPGARAEYGLRRDYGLHEGWRDRDRTVVIKHRHDEY